MTLRKHTHVGHCQACARTHAVNVKTGAIAKHGYTTRFGFFAGTCGGSDHLTLEVSREYADAVIVRLGEYAQNQLDRAAALRAGTVTPQEVVTGEYERDEQGRWKRDRNGQRILARIPFANGSATQQAAAVDSAITKCGHEVHGARAHAAELAAIIPKIHGQPLVPVKPVDVVADAPLAVGDTVRIGGAKGSDYVVVEIKVKQCQGCGPYLNGQHLPHAVFARENGTRWATPVRTIRKAAIVKRAAQPT